MQKRTIDRLWTYLLLFYSGSMLIFLIPGTPAYPLILALPFYLLIPGYAFVMALFPRMDKLEKLVASIGFSLAFLVGIRGLIHIFKLPNLFSEFTVLPILSLICLITKIVFDR